ncbi:hypothetical protein [Streptomyces sp. NBC_01481]|nr:hypothetical protein [Streptomyces sp. NBC_01481]MCX4586382.1 hypothetical protein [Streptomyces sp. NBC_01481]
MGLDGLGDGLVQRADGGTDALDELDVYAAEGADRRRSARKLPGFLPE